MLRQCRPLATRPVWAPLCSRTPHQPARTLQPVHRTGLHFTHPGQARLTGLAAARARCAGHIGVQPGFKLAAVHVPPRAPQSVMDALAGPPQCGQANVLVEPCTSKSIRRRAVSSSTWATAQGATSASALVNIASTPPPTPTPMPLLIRTSISRYQPRRARLLPAIAMVAGHTKRRKASAMPTLFKGFLEQVARPVFAFKKHAANPFGANGLSGCPADRPAWW